MQGKISPNSGSYDEEFLNDNDYTQDIDPLSSLTSWHPPSLLRSLERLYQLACNTE
ncbi:hypothetical protein QTJ16_000556 [Diplocarpon rosae]|uniref:Uncharacterized protein n=1 Tax=Diplocarpon rosae TaxID=946125 RepID=A0AAD9T554_9HELO|nr:hypothetical protein QTJ16_000556 [Diplocarpon rosae]